MKIWFATEIQLFYTLQYLILIRQITIFAKIIYFNAMVPKFQEFFFPCLKCLSDGNIYTQDLLKKYVINYFNLSEADINELIKSGRKTKVADRVSWTISYFMQAGLIDTQKRGNYKINEYGKQFLSEHMSGFNKNDLFQIPDFAAFASQKNEKLANVSQKNVNFIQQEEYTPTDIIDNAYSQINDSLAKDLLSKILELSPAFFERLVVELLVKMGYGGSFEDAAKVTQYSRDGGVDGVIKEDKLGFDIIYIQAKRYDKKNIVTSSNIRDFIGAIDIHHASKGVFITTSSFSEDAKRNAKDSKSKIILIDGEQLCKYMIEYKLGVTVHQIYEIKQLDTDYFAEQ